LSELLMLFAFASKLGFIFMEWGVLKGYVLCLIGNMGQFS
jgi:hypothetical protein